MGEGASVWVRVASEPIDPLALARRVRDPEHGAVLFFEGRVRRVNDGRDVTRILYEAYAEMAEEVLREIVGEASRRYAVGSVAAVHRTGWLAPGEASVAVAVGAAHREAAYAASRHVIEAIKARLPVWKKEEYADGGARWLDGATPPDPTPDPEEAKTG